MPGSCKDHSSGQTLVGGQQQLALASILVGRPPGPKNGNFSVVSGEEAFLDGVKVDHKVI